LRGNFATKVSNKDVAIGEQYFILLAEYIGFSLVKRYWHTVDTTQFSEGIAKLVDCKESLKTGLIIGGTGFGKSDFLEKFMHKKPKHTYVITISSLYRLTDVVNELADMLGLDSTGTMKQKVDRVVQKLQDIKRLGGKPIIILDEGENMRMPLLHMIKGLYDALRDYCSIVVIATPELLKKLDRLRKKEKDGIPQLYRRFKAGLKVLTPINKTTEFPKFFDKMGVADAGLQTLIYSLADNYGELHDYLQPVLKEADEKSQMITEKLFRMYHDMPKIKYA
jgi:DNA transposition AAA+ family ATPase